MHRHQTSLTWQTARHSICSPVNPLLGRYLDSHACTSSPVFPARHPSGSWSAIERLTDSHVNAKATPHFLHRCCSTVSIRLTANAILRAIGCPTALWAHLGAGEDSWSYTVWAIPTLPSLTALHIESRVWLCKSTQPSVANKSRLSVLSLCVRLQRASGLLSLPSTWRKRVVCALG